MKTKNEPKNEQKTKRTKNEKNKRFLTPPRKTITEKNRSLN